MSYTSDNWLYPLYTGLLESQHISCSYTNREFNFFCRVGSKQESSPMARLRLGNTQYGMHLIHSKTSRLHRLHATNKNKVICKTLYIYTMKRLLIPLHARCSVEYYSLSRLFYAVIVSGAHQPCHYQLAGSHRGKLIMWLKQQTWLARGYIGATLRLRPVV